MAELKHHFTGGRMNKDLDERLVPNGEYKDALNVNVNVSEGSDVGTVQTTLGNVIHRIRCGIPNTAIVVFSNMARCVGSITDEKNNKLYWFIADPKSMVDAIAEYDIETGNINPILVDPWRTVLRRTLNFSNTSYITGINIIDNLLFWTDNNSEPKKINIDRSRQGSVDFCTCTKFLTPEYSPVIGGEQLPNTDFGDSSYWYGVGTPGPCMGGGDKNWSIHDSLVEGLANCEDPNNPGVYLDTYLTTPFRDKLYKDNWYKLTYTITRESSGELQLDTHDTSWNNNTLSIPTTIGTHYVLFQQNQPWGHPSEDTLHLRISSTYTGMISGISLVPVAFNEDPGTLTSLIESPCVEEKHITVIKENPVLAPVLEMSQTPSRSSRDISGQIGPVPGRIAQAWCEREHRSIAGTTSSSSSVGGTLYPYFQATPSQPTPCVASSGGFDPVFWRDNIGRMGWHDNSYTAYAPFPNTTYSIPVLRDLTPASHAAYTIGYRRSFIVTGNPNWQVDDVITLTSNNDPSGVRQVQVRVTEIFGGIIGYWAPSTLNWRDPEPDYLQFEFEILDIHPDVDASDLSWSAVLLQPDSSMFEFKFPRFATRYKYQDGEYSAFSPFTEVAFLPGRPMDEDFKYEPKQGFNLGMTNNVRHLALKNFVPQGEILPDGVIAIDILYKESNSPNVYIVKTITPGDLEWNLQIDGSLWNGTRGYVQIKSEMIHAILPENQLLRPWDNVPRKAKSQEVSGNRLIYGNYLQNYNVSGIQEIELGLESKCLGSSCLKELEFIAPEEIYPELAHQYLPGKSIKTLRTYQLGIVYRDKYGRETPVITESERVKISGKASIYIEKGKADYQNKLTAQLHSQPPSWATTYKWFIKETSNEYYNLSLDRWYDAQDHNVWLSFPSSERNKVDIETFLILKKEADTNTFVENQARYKILAIDSDAPDYIKERHITLAVLNDVDISGGGVPDSIGTSTGIGFPIEFGNVIYIHDDEMENQGLYDSATSELRVDVSKNLWVRMGGGGIYSDWYIISSISHDTNLNFWKFSVEGQFGPEMNFTSSNPGSVSPHLTRTSPLYMELKEKILEDRPEFDGRFFAKIHRDLTLDDTVINLDPSSMSWVPRWRMTTSYVGPRWSASSGNQYNNTSPYSSLNGDDLSPGAYALAQNDTNPNDWADSNWATFQHDPDTAYGQVGGNDARRFWKKFGGGIDPWLEDPDVVMFIDNAEHQPPSNQNGSESGRNGNHCYGSRSKEVPNGIGVYDFWCGPAASSQQQAMCHDHCWVGTGGAHSNIAPNNSSGLPLGWDTDWNRSNGGTWGISRLNHQITLSLQGTGSLSWSSGSCNNNHSNVQADSGAVSGGEMGDPGYPGLTAGDLTSKSRWGAHQNANFIFESQINFLDEIRNPGTYWRWVGDPDQVVYRTKSVGKKDNILLNMNFYHSYRDTLCHNTGIQYVVCDPYVATWIPYYYNANVIAEQLTAVGRRHAFEFQAEVAFGPNAGQPPGNDGGYGYLPTNDPRYACMDDGTGVIVCFPNLQWNGNGVPASPTVSGVAYDANTDTPADADGAANCSHQPNFNPNQYWPGIRSDGEAGDGNGGANWRGSETWEILDPAGLSSNGGHAIEPSTNPAIFETEPKEDVGLNIYHEIGQVYPVEYGTGTNEMFTPPGSEVTCWRPGYGWVDLGGSGTNVPGTGDPWIPPIKVYKCIDDSVKLVDAVGTPFENNANWLNEHIGIADTLVFTRPDGSSTQTSVVNLSPGSSWYKLERMAWKYKSVLPWFNCYSFGNGVESDRIRDDYNQVTIDNGPKASSSLDDPYEEERRGSGLIYSGIYNSTSGVNNLNQFVMAEKVTKDINPTYGTIQKLFSRNTNLVTLCEDKILKVLANKDAMYNADGNINVTSNLNVLGQSVPFVGEYGISKNPESFASESYRAYFSDKQRGVVLRLSQDGVTPISEFGMRDWFADNLLLADRIIGSYDSKKQLYNITLGIEDDENAGPVGPGGPRSLIRGSGPFGGGNPPPITPPNDVHPLCEPTTPCTSNMQPAHVNKLPHTWYDGFPHSGFHPSYTRNHNTYSTFVSEFSHDLITGAWNDISSSWAPPHAALNIVYEAGYSVNWFQGTSNTFSWGTDVPCLNGCGTQSCSCTPIVYPPINPSPFNPPVDQNPDFLGTSWIPFWSRGKDDEPWNYAGKPLIDATGVTFTSNLQHSGTAGVDNYVHEHNSCGMMSRMKDLCVGGEYILEIDCDVPHGRGRLFIGQHMQNQTALNVNTYQVPFHWTDINGLTWNNDIAGVPWGTYLDRTGGAGSATAPFTISHDFTATDPDQLLIIDWHGQGNLTANQGWDAHWECDELGVAGCIGGITVQGTWDSDPVEKLKITDVRVVPKIPAPCICGCMDSFAANFDPDATCNDGSCYRQPGCPCTDGSYQVICCPEYVPVKWYEYFKTLSFSENSKGWVSFKSFLQENGLSLNNTYFTFKEGQLWEHHANPNRNMYYGVQFDSSINILFNEAPETVKSFLTVNYEGSQSRITQDITAISTGGLYDDIPHFDDVPKKGWYVEFMETNLQTAGVLEFKNKEGKWFSYPRGNKTDWDNDSTLTDEERGNIDPREFSYQGISNNCCRTINNRGVITQTGTCCIIPCTGTTYNIISVTDSTVNTSTNPCTLNADGEIQITATSTTINCTTWDIDLTYTGSGTYTGQTSFLANANGSILTIPNLVPGSYTIDITFCNGGPNCEVATTVVVDSASVQSGCMDSSALNYCASCVCDDGSCTYPVPGCTDPSAINCDPGCNGFNPLATVDDGSCCIAGCDDPNANNYIANAHCSIPCTYDPSWDCSGSTGTIFNGVTIAPWNCYDPGYGTGQYQNQGTCTASCQPNNCMISNLVLNNDGTITFNYNAPNYLIGDKISFKITDANGTVLYTEIWIDHNTTFNSIGGALSGTGTITTVLIPSGPCTGCPSRPGFVDFSGKGVITIELCHKPHLVTNPTYSQACCLNDIDTGQPCSQTTGTCANRTLIPGLIMGGAANHLLEYIANDQTLHNTNVNTVYAEMTTNPPNICPQPLGSPGNQPGDCCWGVNGSMLGFIDGPFHFTYSTPSCFGPCPPTTQAGVVSTGCGDGCTAYQAGGLPNTIPGLNTSGYLTWNDLLIDILALGIPPHGSLPSPTMGMNAQDTFAQLEWWIHHHHGYTWWQPAWGCINISWCTTTGLCDCSCNNL